MKYSLMPNELSIDYTATNQSFVGFWFGVLGTLTVIIPGLVIRSEDNVAFIVGGSAFALIGIIIFLSTPRIRTHVSRNSQTISIEKTSRLKCLNKTDTYSMIDAAKIEVASFSYSARPMDKGMVIYMVLRDGKQIKIAAQQNYSSSVDKTQVHAEDAISLAEDLSSFIGVPLNSDPNKIHPLDS